jgi:exodeoxyribonuclease V gamma subunit
MREVEVLHDRLLALFTAAPDLEPSQVVVMTPDIETYAPYVEAVFATAEPRIPFNISDRSAEQESTLAATFMALLELPGSRYDANRVLAILDEPSVQRRFSLSESDLETARRWVRESQIRWGIDAPHRARFGLPATHEHTWRFGLDRLLLGYALPGGNERLFADVLPYDEVEGSLGGVLGRFQSFAEAAIALDSQFAGARPIAQWCERMQGLLARFFEPPEERAEELEALRTCVAGLEREARTARYSGAVPLAVVVAALRGRLEAPGRAFLSGGVTFCAMVPMRSLPFEAVCMIGMNDGAFPRVRRRDGFDLMANDFRKGDRSRRDDDHYLFLESILSARRFLYVSYTGRHIREDTVMPPSVLVSELLEYVARSREAPGGADIRQRLVTQHPLQAFSPRYFEGDDRLFSYSHTLARAASVAGRGVRSPQPFMTEALPAPDAESRHVDLEGLIRFFRNPTRYLFERRLKVRLETADEEIEAREPFELNGLPLFALKQRLLDLRLRGVPHDALALARAGGVLPHGAMGEILFEDQNALLERFAETIAPLLPAEVFDPVSFDLVSGPVTLTGALSGVSADGILDYRVVRASANLRVGAWIRHLALNAFAPRGVGRTTRCVSQDCVLRFAPIDDARNRLEELLELYWCGLQRPLHFFPRTSCAFVDEGAMSAKVRAVWNGGYDGTPPGERADPYYMLAFRNLVPLDEAFERAARALFVPLKAALTEEPLG